MAQPDFDGDDMLDGLRKKRFMTTMTFAGAFVAATLFGVNLSTAQPGDSKFTITIKGSSLDGKGKPWTIWIYDDVRCDYAVKNAPLSDKKSQTATLVARKGWGDKDGLGARYRFEINGWNAKENKLAYYTSRAKIITQNATWPWPLPIADAEHTGTTQIKERKCSVRDTE